jgi:hypothetical protein
MLANFRETVFLAPELHNFLTNNEENPALLEYPTHLFIIGTAHIEYTSGESQFAREQAIRFDRRLRPSGYSGFRRRHTARHEAIDAARRLNIFAVRR